MLKFPFLEIWDQHFPVWHHEAHVTRPRLWAALPSVAVGRCQGDVTRARLRHARCHRALPAVRWPLPKRVHQGRGVQERHGDILQVASLASLSDIFKTEILKMFTLWNFQASNWTDFWSGHHQHCVLHMPTAARLCQVNTEYRSIYCCKNWLETI